MLTKTQEKLIRSLHTKKGREQHNLCLVEGQKNIEAAGDYVQLIFTNKDTKNFSKLVTTQTPQNKAAIAKVPFWSESQVLKNDITVVLDGVQDPGNVGSIFRLCLAFNASLILIKSADSTNPKTLRSSAGSVFAVPHINLSITQFIKCIHDSKRTIYRLEKKSRAVNTITKKPAFLIAGSEGNGITLNVEGAALTVKHNPKLESLNVGHALAIVLANAFET